MTSDPGSPSLSAPWPAGFFASRWRGQVPLGRLLWRDMLAVGSLVNLVASLFALALAAKSAPLGLAAALHLAPLPYNAFLLAAVWRHPQRSPVQAALAAGWFLLALVV